MDMSNMLASKMNEEKSKLVKPKMDINRSSCRSSCDKIGDSKDEVLKVNDNTPK